MDHAGGKRAGESQRAADGDHQFARPQRVGIARRGGGQSAFRDLQDRQIAPRIARDQARAGRRRPSHKTTSACRSARHMRVGHDPAVGTPDHARAAAIVPVREIPAR